MSKQIPKIALPAILVLIVAGCEGHDISKDEKGAKKKASIIVDRSRPQTPGGKENGPIEVEQMVATADQPVSTFSIDVDTAAYTRLRSNLNRGAAIRADDVRIEEMINYFDYDYESEQEQLVRVLTDLTESPWHPNRKLLRLALKGRSANLETRIASHLVFLIDVSGSMASRDKLALAKESLLLLTEQLSENDLISIVTYAAGSKVALAAVGGSEKESIWTAISALGAGGATNGQGAINLAYQIATEHFVEGGVNRVLLVTDGDFNVGISRPDDLKDFIAEKRSSGVFLTVLGFGAENYMDQNLETLADHGNGVYAYIDNQEEGRRVMLSQMHKAFVTVAKDVKIQIHFDPDLVVGYRLIGYDNRRMAAEEFADDAKDAGELCAGDEVTALYEIELDPQVSANQQIAALELRFKEPYGSESQLIQRPIRYTSIPFSESDPDFKFATAVAGFGMLIKNPQTKNEGTISDILEMAASGDPRQLPARVEFQELVRMWSAQKYSINR